MNRQRLNRESGITMIEMLVLAAVVVSLSMLAVPSFKSFRERMYGAEAKAKLLEINQAQRAFFAERGVVQSLPTTTNYTADAQWEAVGLENPNKNPGRKFDFEFNPGNKQGKANRLGTTEDIKIDWDGEIDESNYNP